MNLNDTLGRLQERMSSLEKASLSSTARSDAPSEPSVEEEEDEEHDDELNKEDIAQRLVVEMERLIEDGLHAKKESSNEGGDARGINKDDVNLTKALEELVSRTLLKADADDGMADCPMPIVIVNRSG